MIDRSTVAPSDKSDQKDEQDDVYGGLLGEEVNGGWGYGISGVGPGGGGTGWGTISPPPPPSTVGKVSLGKVKATGRLDKAIIRRYMRRRLPRIRFCYEKELLKRSKLRGTVKLRFTIGPTGKVLAANARGVLPAVSRCVAKAVRTIQFPRPNGGGKVVVNYPFLFLPASGNVQGGVVGGIVGPVGVAAPNSTPPKIVPQQAIESKRISGDKQIHPPTDVITKIAHSQKRAITVVKMCLDKSGNVNTLSMLKSSGYPSYDTKIKSEMRRWKYRPFLVNGNTVPVCTSVTFIYVPSPVLTQTHTARPPRVRPGTVSTSTSALSKEVIRRVARQVMPKIRHCYEREFAKQPKLQGRVETKYTIGPDGSVRDVKVAGFHPKTSGCLKKVLSGLHFPRPKGGASVIVSYPYFFTQTP
ncbi:MAG: AgmX/PglI C-terminal domain-containing protein [Kofleriaceae bacterium]|nr:AgmX/PglI C-terminal domain-containing protein [Kofleriaceae bacterium]